MSKRAENSGVSLNPEEVAIVKGMLKRGDRQHDVAAWFGVNGGRIAEIAKGLKHKDVKAKEKGLPPKGPYLAAKGAIIALEAAQDTISTALSLIAERRKKYSQF